MTVATLCKPVQPSPHRPSSDETARLIDADQFRDLLVSHRRMVRVDRRADRLLGLQDLDTGEIFLTDQRRLLDEHR
jgi:hypothetical protein